MRETYSITDQTREVLTDHVADIATEWDKDKSHLYQILSNVESDPFAKFRSFYAACVRADVDVSPWDAHLASIKARYHTTNKHETECLADSILQHADLVAKWVEALQDGIISEREGEDLAVVIQRERNSLDALEVLLTRRAERREKAATKTANRFSGAAA